MNPKISVVLPHWQVLSLAKICLRSIRKHSSKYNLEVIVVDNGSKDESLDWLRSLRWIKLIERPEEGPFNFPGNVFSSWNLGLLHATGEFYVTMHTDVFIKSDDWLQRFLDVFQQGDPNIIGVGGWKLGLESSVYRWQKEVFGDLVDRVKRITGLRSQKRSQIRKYPRDYCAMYRRTALISNGFDFGVTDGKGGGYHTAKQIWDAGYEVSLIPLPEMHQLMAHIAHGTAAIEADASFHLSRRGQQVKASNRVKRIFEEPWVKQLINDQSLDL